MGRGKGASAAAAAAGKDASRKEQPAQGRQGSEDAARSSLRTGTVGGRESARKFPGWLRREGPDHNKEFRSYSKNKKCLNSGECVLTHII